MATETEMKLLVEAVKAGILNPVHIQDGLNQQKALADEGQKTPILNILVKKGYLSQEAAQVLVLEHKLGQTEQNAAFQPVKGYKILKLLGKGGVARVFLAEAESGGAPVALKIMHPLQNLNAVFVERFVNEARLLKKFDCELIVKGLDYGKSNGLHFFAMELLVGESVQDLLDKRGTLDEDTALFIIVQIAKALEYCMQQGILHRDIKPDNIMITKSGGVKLCDLGFAKPIEACAGQEDTTCGTPQYISPEQARGLSDVDIRADIYSLGATLYHMVVGTVPFSGADSMEVMAKQILEDLSVPREHNKNVTMHLQYFIQKMMAKEREVRYQSARDLIEDIESQIKGKKTLVFDPEREEGSLESEEGLFSGSSVKKAPPREGDRKPARDGRKPLILPRKPGPKRPR
ncbi:MAG: serine/threonine protein kinase [Planctomycetes bacterium]|nr:serine/threonine protein kinase [Planctomycetota bacterium]